MTDIHSVSNEDMNTEISECISGFTQQLQGLLQRLEAREAEVLQREVAFQVELKQREQDFQEKNAEREADLQKREQALEDSKSEQQSFHKVSFYNKLLGEMEALKTENRLLKRSQELRSLYAKQRGGEQEPAEQVEPEGQTEQVAFPDPAAALS